MARQGGESIPDRRTYMQRPVWMECHIQGVEWGEEGKAVRWAKAKS